MRHRLNEPDLIRRLAQVDLNLLSVLHAILETGSTSAAALRLGRTQSAVSHALGRLRDLFHDPLFTRYGPKLTPTPLALALREPLARLLSDAISMVETGKLFDPATTDRRVVIAAPDLCSHLSTIVARELTKEAPGLRLRVINLGNGTPQLLTGEADLVLSLYATEYPAGVDVHRLMNCHWAVMARDGHPISDRPTPREWASYGHVQVGTGPSSQRNPVGDAAAVAGVTREVRAQVSSFLEALNMAANSDLLFSTLGTLALPHAKRLGLRTVAMPFAIPPIPMALVTRSTAHDALSEWLQTVALEALNGINASE